MGIDLRIALDHSLQGLEVYSIPDRLGWTFNPDEHFSTQEWDLRHEGTYNVSGPAGWALEVGLRSFRVTAPHRWEAFTANADLAGRTRQAVSALAARLGSNRAIYLPDSALVEAEAGYLVEMVDLLPNRCKG